MEKKIITNLDNLKFKLIRKILTMDTREFEKTFGNANIISTCPKTNGLTCSHKENEEHWHCYECSINWLNQQVNN